jgi:hypothetical protein
MSGGDTVASKPTKIKVPADSDLARALKAAGSDPVVVESNGELYRLDRMEKEPAEDIWAGYDPEKVRDAIDRYAGTITQEEADAWIADLYRARKEGSRPADRP